MVVKGMTRAEMILKVVMDASDTNAKYVAQYNRLLPESDASEFQKILDMKGVRRSDQQPLVDLYRAQQQVSQGGFFHIQMYFIMANVVTFRIKLVKPHGIYHLANFFFKKK